MTDGTAQAPHDQEWRLLARGNAEDLVHAAGMTVEHAHAFATAASFAVADNGEIGAEDNAELEDLAMLERLLGQVDVWARHVEGEVAEALERIARLRSLNLRRRSVSTADVGSAKAAFIARLAQRADLLGPDGQQKVLDLVEAAMGRVGS